MPPAPTNPNSEPGSVQPITPVQSPAPGSQGVQTSQSTEVVIDNVDQSTWDYIKHGRHLALFLVMIIGTVVWELGWIWLIANTKIWSSSTPTSTNNDGHGIVYIMGAPIAGIMIWYARIKKKFEDQFLSQFATANGYTFVPTGQLNEIYGEFFNIGYNRQVYDVVSGLYQNHPLRLFLYQYTVGSGRSQVTYRKTILEVDFGANLPHVLVSNQFGGSWIKRDISAEWNKQPGLERLHVEGEFDKKFGTYITTGQQVEALEILTPDVMAQIMDLGGNFDFELAGSKLHVYLNGFINKRDQLQTMYSLTKILSAKLGPVLQRMTFDSKQTPQTLPAATDPKKTARLAVWFVVGFAVLMMVLIIILITTGSRPT